MLHVEKLFEKHVMQPIVPEEGRLQEAAIFHGSEPRVPDTTQQHQRSLYHQQTSEMRHPQKKLLRFLLLPKGSSFINWLWLACPQCFGHEHCSQYFVLA